MRPRRFLPSISQLLAFEAVLRSRSTTAAARDLNLTQSTVSRLVQTLEEQLGCTLFIRQRKRLIPTEAALSYGADITRGLNLIQQASTALLVNPAGGAVARDAAYLRHALARPAGRRVSGNAPRHRAELCHPRAAF
ncbi:LysR family transcriptional regulator [Gemmobacter lanyuensis]